MLKVVNVKNVSWDVVDVYIGRAGKNGIYNINNTNVFKKGWLGNPYKLSKYSREESIYLYSKDFIGRMINEKKFRRAVIDVINGNLGCWCRPLLCHGDVIKYFTEQLRNGINEGDLCNDYAVLFSLKKTIHKLKKKNSNWLANVLKNAHDVGKDVEKNKRKRCI